MPKTPKAVSEWLAKIGAEGGKKGGKAKGSRKARAPEHYAKMVLSRKQKNCVHRWFHFDDGSSLCLNCELSTASSASAEGKK